MEQLLLHLLGDYITQTDWMARANVRRSLAALVHCLVYGLPFLLLEPSMPALAMIIVSHFFIDRFRLARYLVFAKNWLNQPSLRWADCSETGFPKSSPIWLSTWLMIITDNTMHMAINYASLRWL